MNPKFFRGQKSFRTWLDKNHDRLTEQWVGFYRKSSEKGGMSYDEAVDAALCFGWIDGIIRKIDDVSYMHRFTPRKATSSWSAVNLKKMERLLEAKLVAPAGLAAYQGRDRRKDAQYSYERDHAEFTPTQLRRFMDEQKAWAHWDQQPAGYRKTATYWVISAKRPETRERRFTILIETSAELRRLPQFL